MRAGAALTALVFLLLAALLPLPAGAHDPGLSHVRVVVRPDALEAQIALPWVDTAAASDAALGAHGFAARIGGAALALAAVDVRRVPGDLIEVSLRFARGAASSGPLELDSRMLESLPFGHKQFVRVFDAEGAALGSGVLSAYAPSLSLQIE